MDYLNFDNEKVKRVVNALMQQYQEKGKKGLVKSFKSLDFATWTMPEIQFVHKATQVICIAKSVEGVKKIMADIKLDIDEVKCYPAIELEGFYAFCKDKSRLEPLAAYIPLIEQEPEEFLSFKAVLNEFITNSYRTLYCKEKYKITDAVHTFLFLDMDSWPESDYCLEPKDYRYYEFLLENSVLVFELSWRLAEMKSGEDTDYYLEKRKEEDFERDWRRSVYKSDSF